MDDKLDASVQKILAELRADMEEPAILRSHPKMKAWTGVGSRRLANLDSEGKGPRERVLIGKQVAYPRDALLEWIASRLKAA